MEIKSKGVSTAPNHPQAQTSLLNQEWPEASTRVIQIKTNIGTDVYSLVANTTFAKERLDYKKIKKNKNKETQVAE